MCCLQFRVDCEDGGTVFLWNSGYPPTHELSLYVVKIFTSKMAVLAPWIMSSWTIQNRIILKMHHAFYGAPKLSCCLNFDSSSLQPPLAIEYWAVCREEVFPHSFMPSNAGIFVLLWGNKPGSYVFWRDTYAGRKQLRKLCYIGRYVLCMKLEVRTVPTI